jgi:hypothetical protein
MTICRELQRSHRSRSLTFANGKPSPKCAHRSIRLSWDNTVPRGELIWWARSDSNRGPRDSLFPAVSSGSGLSLHPLIYEEKGVRDARACH